MPRNASEIAEAVPLSLAGSFLAPRQTVFADGALSRVGTALTELGLPAENRDVLMLVDPVVEDLGIASVGLDALRSAGFSATCLVVAPGEPSLESVREIVAAVRDSHAVAVVALGGGSTIDQSKIAALLARNEGDVLEYIGALDRSLRAATPVVAIPTTAGTGAESTKVAVFSVDGYKRVVAHPTMIPAVVILDPELLRSLPAATTAATGMDALAHAIEAFLSRNRTYFSAQASFAAIELLSIHLPIAVRDGEEITARRGTLYGAHLAGLALNAGVILGHSLAYTIAGRAPLSHGVTCAMALPYCLAYCASDSERDLQLLARRALRDESAGVDELLKWLVDLNEDFGMPTDLHSLGIAETAVPDMVEECIVSYPRPNNPRPFDRDALSELYRCLHAGALDKYAAGTALSAGREPR